MHLCLFANTERHILRRSFKYCLFVVRHFDEIVIWISEVQGGDCPHSSTSLHWALLYLHSTNLQRKIHNDNGKGNMHIKMKTDSWGSTFRCAATVVRGVLVMRHKSAEPDVGCLAFGWNSWPNWWRLNFCFPNPRALRFPWRSQNRHVRERCVEAQGPSLLTEQSCYQLTYNQSLPSGGFSPQPEMISLFPRKQCIYFIIITLIHRTTAWW